MQNTYFLKPPDWIKISNKSESFQDFIAYTILSETLFNVTPPLKVYNKDVYQYFGLDRKQYYITSHQIILVGSKSYSFLSCYGIKKENSYQVFTDPFHTYVWLSIITIVLVFTLITTVPKHRSVDMDIVILTFSVLLEISLTERIKKGFPSKIIRHLFWVWIFSSIVLTSYYKDIFTTEVILPFKPSLTWDHIYDLFDQKGFQFYFPVPAHVETYFESYSNGTPFRSIYDLESYIDIKLAASYGGNLPRLLGYKRLAEALLASEGDLGMKRIWKGLHYKWPFDIYSNLSNCGRSVYLDERENIRDIIPFLNDNKDGTVFMSGADKDFLLEWNTIEIDPTPRGNFVLKRVKFLLTSGIYHWWEAWFAKTRPKKLFPYYANWTKPKLGALERLDFVSKFTTILRIWVICCGICGVVGIIEIGMNYCALCIMEKVLNIFGVMRNLVLEFI
ncbi:hypothetical protein Fcan01_24244 [Folsomia candida]|uniref:Uncharacterized protein n=1 Tax=Folsomia candida TaxID=158441 RepID=A0A226D603_FOLCA|nr:hypothetical protein Fcan01_24244 [Folsomia candida]